MSHAKKTAQKHRFHKRPWYRKWVLWRRLSAVMFLALLILAQFDWFPWFSGTTTGTRILGVVPLIDPLAGAEMMIASRSVTMTMLIGVVILLLAAALLGPIFCGFVCPLGLVLDLNQTLRRVFRRVVLRKSKRHAVSKAVPGWVRYAMLGGLIGFALMTGVPLFQAVSPINLLARALVMGSLIGLAVVGAILVLEWFLPRVWCRALCPLGACYSIAGRKAIWQVRINPQTSGQVKCKQCQIRCPMGIEIMNEYTIAGHDSISHPSCIRCGDCIDICPNTVLGLRVRPFPPKENDAHPHADGDVHLPVLESSSDMDEAACEHCG